MNIFVLSDQNSDNLRQSYRSLKVKFSDSNKLNTFIEMMKKSTISINMRQWALNNFLIAGKYYNLYELKKERADELKKVIILDITPEDVLKKYLKNYYESRKIFNNYFDGSQKFTYGALNIGGLGIQKYGEYCVIIKYEQSNIYTSLIFIKEDSLNYVEGNILNIDKLSNDSANRECIRCLAALKHEIDLEKTPENKWASMICCNKNYIEAITMDDILIEHIESVRISKIDYNIYYDYLYKDLISELDNSDLSDVVKKYRLEDFRNMLILLDKQRIKLEVIEKNEN